MLKDFENIQRAQWEKWKRARALVDSQGRETVGFIEGPPTMNGEPHIGHVRGRVIKDMFYRIETLKGKRVVFRAGWDTQGLPVELEAEKELGITGNKNQVLSSVGEDTLVKKCKEIVHKYNEFWVNADHALGMMFDYEQAYWTYRDEYIEREWEILKAAHERRLLYEDYRVVAYCPSCQTSLSNSEVALGYKEVTDPSLFYKVKLVDRDLYLVVWTTMPFTIVTDEAVAVNPDETYKKLKVGEETWLVGSTSLESFLKTTGIEPAILGEVKGSELEGSRYGPPLLEFIPAQQKMFSEGKAHSVLAESFVDVTAGSGIVHLSPANGEEDFEVGKKRSLPVFNPIDDQVRFTDEAGKYAGLFVRDADNIIAEDLKAKGLLVKYGKIKHSYPTCWRSGHKLIYMARKEYFYDIGKIGEQALDQASRVEYFYEQPRNRFLDIIREKKPWCISRERVWGTPLPVWTCKSCGRKIYLFSRKDIVDNAESLPDGQGFELHKPWIDRVVVKCPYCGGSAYREPFVLDTWHNSGAAPYASLNKEEYSRIVPADFLTEAIDQTRGWAYTLLIEGVMLNGKSPYSSFLFTGHVVDEKGEKMSKSKGNVVYARDILSKYPADLVRLYLMWKASPIDTLNFDKKEMMERPYQILNTLSNLHIYYSINAKYDGYSWSEENRGKISEKERWIISELSEVAESYMEYYEKRKTNEMIRLLDRFLIEEVSQKYVPVIRNELWDDSPEMAERRNGIYWTLGKLLRSLDILLHPIAPYLTDSLFESTFGARESIIIYGFEPVDSGLVDRPLIDKYSYVWNVVSLSNSARMKARLKRRWPLNKMLLFSGKDSIDKSYFELIGQLSNVKEVFEAKMLDELPIDIKVTVRKGELGKAFKREALDVEKAIQSIPEGSLIEQIIATGNVAAGKYMVPASLFDIKYLPREGYELAADRNLVVVISLDRDEELVKEGYVRDVARRVQYARKEMGYNPTDIIDSAELYIDDAELYGAILHREDILGGLTRVKKVTVHQGKPDGEKFIKMDLDEKTLYIKI
ncbi:MAG: isoleucine--tRNA ligase [Nitrososphaerota archaeon]|nr:isoleucine--tRNA ligase [Nitrososphaerota archaeon]